MESHSCYTTNLCYTLNMLQTRSPFRTTTRPRNQEKTMKATRILCQSLITSLSKEWPP
jgi:hypothetical protein